MTVTTLALAIRRSSHSAIEAMWLHPTDLILYVVRMWNSSYEKVLVAPQQIKKIAYIVGCCYPDRCQKLHEHASYIISTAFFIGKNDDLIRISKIEICQRDKKCFLCSEKQEKMIYCAYINYSVKKLHYLHYVTSYSCHILLLRVLTGWWPPFFYSYLLNTVCNGLNGRCHSKQQTYVVRQYCMSWPLTCFVYILACLLYT